jgi:hypothetical protein
MLVILGHKVNFYIYSLAGLSSEMDLAVRVSVNDILLNNIKTIVER